MGLLEQFYRYAEPAATLGSSALAEPVAGWAGLLGGGADGIERTRAALTYQPRTEQGQAGMNALANALRSAKTAFVDENPPVNALVKALNASADWAGEQHPLLGALGKTAPTALGLFAGPGSAATRSAFSNVGRDAAGGLNRLAQVLSENSTAAPAVRGPLAYQAGALNDSGKNALSVLLRQYEESGAKPASISNAIDLTEPQRKALAEALAAQWGREFPVPSSIGLKPKHGYESRVLKDGYSADDYRRWLISAAEDGATLGVDYMGRPGLLNEFVDPVRNNSYQVKMPIRSDSAGQVYADDVIPMGLKPPKKKMP